jgi:hypothetical protein
MHRNAKRERASSVTNAAVKIGKERHSHRKEFPEGTSIFDLSGNKVNVSGRSGDGVVILCDALELCNSGHAWHNYKATTFLPSLTSALTASQ